MRFVRHGFAGFFLITLAALAFLPQRGPAQQQTPPDYSQSFDKTDAMIPARDGVKLHAEIYAPKNAAEPLPIILERTPYGTVNDAKGYSRKLGRYLEMIHKSALRCQKIVQSLLSFARHHQPERKLSSLNELTEGAVEILGERLHLRVVLHR